MIATKARVCHCCGLTGHDRRNCPERFATYLPVLETPPVRKPPSEAERVVAELMEALMLLAPMAGVNRAAVVFVAKACDYVLAKRKEVAG